MANPTYLPQSATARASCPEAPAAVANFLGGTATSVFPPSSEGSWVDLLGPITARAGEAFVAVPEQVLTTVYFFGTVNTTSLDPVLPAASLTRSTRT